MIKPNRLIASEVSSVQWPKLFQDTFSIHLHHFRYKKKILIGNSPRSQKWRLVQMPHEFRIVLPLMMNPGEGQCSKPHRRHLMEGISEAVVVLVLKIVIELVGQSNRPTLERVLGIVDQNAVAVVIDGVHNYTDRFYGPAIHKIVLQ